MSPRRGPPGRPRGGDAEDGGAGGGGRVGGSAQKGGRGDAGWTEVEHTADVAFRAWAPDLSGLFGECARAVLSQMADVARVEPMRGVAVEASGPSELETLIRFLNEVLFASSSGGLVFGAVEVLEVSAKGASARLSGEPYDPSRHGPLTEVKAATYHGAQLRRSGGLIEVTIILDI